jgi:hypothetical protein
MLFKNSISGLQKMRELYILCLEGGFVSLKCTRNTGFADFSGFFHQIKVCQRLGRKEKKNGIMEFILYTMYHVVHPKLRRLEEGKVQYMVQIRRLVSPDPEIMPSEFPSRRGRRSPPPLTVTVHNPLPQRIRTG